jgi:GMP reductase
MDYKGDMNNLLIELQEDLRSSISYAGGTDLSALLTCEMIAIN